jgi:hypothetical protein
MVSYKYAAGPRTVTQADRDLISRETFGRTIGKPVPALINLQMKGGD